MKKLIILIVIIISVFQSVLAQTVEIDSLREKISQLSTEKAENEILLENKKNSYQVTRKAKAKERLQQEISQLITKQEELNFQIDSCKGLMSKYEQMSRDANKVNKQMSTQVSSSVKDSSFIPTSLVNLFSTNRSQVKDIFYNHQSKTSPHILIIYLGSNSITFNDLLEYYSTRNPYERKLLFLLLREYNKAQLVGYTDIKTITPYTEVRCRFLLYPNLAAIKLEKDVDFNKSDESGGKIYTNLGAKYSRLRQFRSTNINYKKKSK